MEAWANLTVTLARRTGQLNKEDDNKLFNNLLTALHPNKFRNEGHRKLYRFARDMCLALVVDRYGNP